MKKPGQILLVTAIFCLLISGVAGLVYEIVWARYLALFLGHTSYAVVAVLVAFMGGLALGNAGLGAYADRCRHPLRLYAWLEIGIAAYALLFPYYFEWCHAGYVSTARHFQSGGADRFVLKFLFSLLSILAPTVLMGGTLPVLIRLVTRSLGELRGRVSALYFTNSVGAVIGCVLADFWWIPDWGLQATVWAGATLNLLVSIVALVVGGWLPEVSATFGPEPVAADAEGFHPAELNLAIVGIGLSGFVAMLYEVVWTRLLALSLGSSTHAFSLMLITFITGIAAGAGMIGCARRLPRLMTAFGWAELSLAFTLLGSLFFYEYLPLWFAELSGLLVRNGAAYPVYGFLQALLCFLVMFLPTVCLGMTLPLASRIATAELAQTGRSVGAVFSVNTLGTVLGAAFTGLWLMPQFGLARTFVVGIALNLAIGLMILGRRSLSRRPYQLGLFPLLAMLLVWWVGARFEATWRQAFTLCLWRDPKPPADLREYRHLIRANTISFYRDGAGATVSLHPSRRNGPENMTLRVNGKAEASSTGDELTQLLLGHLPALLHGKVQQGLVVGLGSGMTCGAVLRHPSMEHLDVVEILPEVAEAARRFSAHNDRVLENPRLHLVVEDAKSFLQITGQPYDLIVSEPSNPWMAGVAGVFSQEFYAHCRNRLRPQGIMAQWVQVYESSDAMLDIVLATFASVFPCLNIWQGSPGDLILIGSLEPLQIDLGELQRRFDQPALQPDWARMRLARLPVFLSLELVSAANAQYIPNQATPLHSDFFPTLEYEAQRAFFLQHEIEFYRRYNENFSARPTTLLGEHLRRHPLAEEDYRAFAQFFARHHLPETDLFRSLLDRWQRESPKALMPVELSAILTKPRPGAEIESLRLGLLHDRILELAPSQPSPLRLYASLLLQTYRSQRSVFYTPDSGDLEKALQRLVEIDPGNQRVHRLRLAELAWDHGNDNLFFQLGQAGLNPDTNTLGPIAFDLDLMAPARVLAGMLESLWRAGQMREAATLAEEVRKNRFAGPGALHRDPLLETTLRKVEAAITVKRPSH